MKWAGAAVTAVLALCLGMSSSHALLPLDSEGRVLSFLGGTADGASPRGDLLLLSDQALYGTLATSGAGNAGTVFRMAESAKDHATETTLWSFDSGTQGSFPSAGLINDPAGTLYGTLALDGAAGGGAVFQLIPPASGDTAWSEATLWSFGAAGDGVTPLGSLILDQSGSGVVYGTTSLGGANGLGTVFSLTPPSDGQTSWSETILWSFSGGADGATPVAGLVQDANGVLYGTAQSGGTGGVGVVFALTPPSSDVAGWSLSPIWTFTGGSDGANPAGTLTFDSSGVLYGTAQFGGSGVCPMTRWPYYDEPDSVTEPSLNAPYVGVGGNGCGVVFALMPPSDADSPWTETLPWSFTGGLDGANPVSKLIDVSDVLWGTTPIYGGMARNDHTLPPFSGNVFNLTPPAQPGDPYTETTVGSFQFKKGGFYPRAGVTLGSDNKYYATTGYGGKTWEHTKDYGYGALISVGP